jgi:molybdopterin-guanine dinucleotide biosynthesis protein A
VERDDITGAILVGGLGRRMGGRTKATLSVGDERIVDSQLRTLREAGIRDVLLVGRWTADPPDIVRRALDVVDGKGPLAGIYTALLVASTPIVVVIAGDMPFVTAPLLRHLARACVDTEAAVVLTQRGWQPLCAAYRRSAAALLKARLDRGALRTIDALNDLQVRAVRPEELPDVAWDDMLLMNVNTPEDLSRAQHHARSRTPLPPPS